MGGGNLNLDEVQEPVSMLTAGCASHTSVASIQKLRTSQSAIFWSGCNASPFLIILRRSAYGTVRASVCWGKPGIGPECCVWVCGATAPAVHEHFVPTNSIFPTLSPASTNPPFSGLSAIWSMPPFLSLRCCACAAIQVHTFDCSLRLDARCWRLQAVSHPLPSC